MPTSAGTNLFAINARLDRYGLANAGSSSNVISPGVQASPNSTMSRSLEKVVQRGGLAQPIANRLDLADLRMTATEYFSIWLLTFVIAMLVGLLVKGTLGLMAGGILGLAVPWFYLSRRINKRRKKF